MHQPGLDSLDDLGRLPSAGNWYIFAWMRPSSLTLITSFSRHTFKSGKARIPEDVAAALTPAQWQAFTRSIKSK
jgi:hypothetical protein